MNKKKLITHKYYICIYTNISIFFVYSIRISMEVRIGWWWWLAGHAHMKCSVMYPPSPYIPQNQRVPVSQSTHGRCQPHDPTLDGSHSHGLLPLLSQSDGPYFSPDRPSRTHLSRPPYADQWYWLAPPCPLVASQLT